MSQFQFHEHAISFLDMLKGEIEDIRSRERENVEEDKKGNDEILISDERKDNNSIKLVSSNNREELIHFLFKLLYVIIKDNKKNKDLMMQNDSLGTVLDFFVNNNS